MVRRAHPHRGPFTIAPAHEIRAANASSSAYSNRVVLSMKQAGNIGLAAVILFTYFLNQYCVEFMFKKHTDACSYGLFLGKFLACTCRQVVSLENVNELGGLKGCRSWWLQQAEDYLAHADEEPYMPRTKELRRMYISGDNREHAKLNIKRMMKDEIHGALYTRILGLVDQL